MLRAEFFPILSGILSLLSYGDKVPNSIAGRVLSMIWILYGTVLVGLTTASLTMALNTVFVVTSTDVTIIYGAQVRVNGSIVLQLSKFPSSWGGGAHVSHWYRAYHVRLTKLDCLFRISAQRKQCIIHR